jgi:hypothetical protein
MRFLALSAGSLSAALAFGQAAPGPEDLPPPPNLAPTCAGCAGAAQALKDGGLAYDWYFSTRWINTRDAASRFRWTLDKRITPRFSLGIERAGTDSHNAPWRPGLWGYLQDSDGDAVLMPRATWFATPETKNTPSVVFGVGSDRLSIPHGQAYFATFSKSIPGTKLAPFVSLKLGSHDGSVAFPFGLNWSVAPEWTLQAINDGNYTHLLVSWQKDKVGVSLMSARSRNFGVQVNLAF